MAKGKRKETPVQRWSRMSDTADKEKDPFRKGSMSMRVIKEQQRASRKEGEYGDRVRDAHHMKRSEDYSNPYNKGYFERPYSVIREHEKDRRNVAKRDSSRAIDELKRGKSRFKSSGRS